MSEETLLTVGVVCFSLMITGLFLTSVEFKRRLKKAERKRNRAKRRT